ncbi:hypothetical protein SAMN05421670_1852 [Psychrobacillus psychrotolerans]|uniref:Uncharacterized protein n=1 Tax=Psychrobacillus psychrotolerans TaxID=126156 RepID=A0A1I5Y250_9BACI|nr:hypothetical protein [Psychrobacillus psychrotolerans]SFQ38269.1 hypothetical protein SAMN05421670_1852 [Psychrobacillus psychrotolerans]
MEKARNSGIQRGQAITFRLPSDTPDHILKQMQKLKETERRNFSSKIAEFVLEGVSTSLSKDRETITIPMPKQLSKEQRNWLKHAHSEAMLGNIVYHLLSDPVRAMSILASLNSNALDIDQALYLQAELTEEIDDELDISTNTSILTEQENNPPELPDDEIEDDLMNFDWEQAKQEHATTEEDSEESTEMESLDDLLGDFLSRMNK